jgi:hypothetical protein
MSTVILCGFGSGFIRGLHPGITPSIHHLEHLSSTVYRCRQGTTRLSPLPDGRGPQPGSLVDIPLSVVRQWPPLLAPLAVKEHQGWRQAYVRSTSTPSGLFPIRSSPLASQGTPVRYLLAWELGDRPHKGDRDDTSIEDGTHQSRAVLRHAHSHDGDIALCIDRTSGEGE